MERRKCLVVDDLRKVFLRECRSIADGLFESFTFDTGRSIALLVSLKYLLKCMSCVVERAAVESFDEFVEVMFGLLSFCFPGHVGKMSESSLRELILYGILRARNFDLSTQRYIASYVCAMMCSGRNFHRISGYRVMLTRWSRLEKEGGSFDEVIAGPSSPLHPFCSDGFGREVLSRFPNKRLPLYSVHHN